MKKIPKYSPYPKVSWINHGFFKKICWSDIDGKIEGEFGLKGVAVPSVRVGICWVLEYFNYRRSENHLLVPKYLSRCILNAISRYAFAVEELTPQTAMVLVVDQFGFRQDIESIERVVLDKNLKYIEDSAAGISCKEDVARNSVGRIIGFSKLLPILKGGVLISPDKELVAFIRKKREEKKPIWYSWLIFLVLARLRSKAENVEYSALADLAYEAYLQSPRDNRLLLNNFFLGLGIIDRYAAATHERLSLISALLGKRVIYPDADRLAHMVLMPPEGREGEIGKIFDNNNFDTTAMHFDMNRNIFNPNYQRVFIIPLNPAIPMKRFNNLIKELSLI